MLFSPAIASPQIVHEVNLILATTVACPSRISSRAKFSSKSIAFFGQASLQREQLVHNELLKYRVCFSFPNLLEIAPVGQRTRQVPQAEQFFSSILIFPHGNSGLYSTTMAFSHLLCLRSFRSNSLSGEGRIPFLLPRSPVSFSRIAFSVWHTKDAALFFTLLEIFEKISLLLRMSSLCFSFSSVPKIILIYSQNRSFLGHFVAKSTRFLAKSVHFFAKIRKNSHFFALFNRYNR